MKTCIIVPVFNHAEAISRVVLQLQPFGLPCYLVNDGSTPPCSAVLRNLAQHHPDWIMLLERDRNGGKGAAVLTGLRQAISDGYSHAVQLDADGQHQTADLDHFLSVSEKYPDHLILGKPAFDFNAPKGRLYGRQFTNLWIRINTLSTAIADGMCGFRCYPLTPVAMLLRSARLGQRMEFDIEIAVRLYWQGVDVINIETAVQYPLDGVSHFDLLKDNWLISLKHAQLFFGMLCRLPRLVMRRRS